MRRYVREDINYLILVGNKAHQAGWRAELVCHPMVRDCLRAYAFPVRTTMRLRRGYWVLSAVMDPDQWIAHGHIRETDEDGLLPVPTIGWLLS
jgi:hypothetical protein